MTAHRRALLLRLGAVAALATGGLVGVASPAYAAAVVGIEVGGATLTVGGSAQTVTVQVKNTGDERTSEDVRLTIDVPLGNEGVNVANRPSECTQSGSRLTCDVGELDPGQQRNLPLSLTPPGQSSIPAGQQREGDLQVVLTAGGSATKSSRITLRAAQQQQTGVTEVSGTVTDSQTGKAINGAAVVMQDSAGKSRNQQTDGSGRFRFVGSANDPIAPGNISITVDKDTYQDFTQSQAGRAGQPLTFRVRMLPTGATASAAPVPTDAAEQPSDVAATPGAETGNQTDTGTKASNDSGSPFSWVLITLGALLVLFGIGAIVLLLRRRDDDGPDEDEDAPPTRRGPQVGGPGAPTRVGGANADPTMISRSPMGAPAMAGRGNANDATAIVRAPRMADDFDVPPDPYGAPPRPNYPPAAPASPPGYGPTSGSGYGANGYNDPAGYGPSAGNGYGPSSRPAVDGYSASDYAGGGYGAAQPPPAYGERGGYGPPDSTQRYEPGAGGYRDAGPSAGYAPSAGNGYGPQSDYDQPYAGRNGYEERGGYGPAPGYDRDRDAYERVPEPPRAGGYGPQQGYDDRGNYYGDNDAPPSRQGPPGRDGRRSLDWLDD